MDTHLTLQGASPFEAARALAKLAQLDQPTPTGLLLLDSGKAADGKALWSILLTDPVAILTEQNGELVELPAKIAVTDPAAWIRQHTAPAQPTSPTHAADIPFHRGVAGMLGFEFAWRLENIHAPCHPTTTPDCWIGAYNTAACYNHTTHQWHLTGPADDPAFSRLHRAIQYAHPSPPTPNLLANTTPTQRATLTLTDAEYCRRVARCVDEIFAGELFEINYTARFEGAWHHTPFALFDALRQRADGTFGAYLQAENFSLASVSPEQFIRIHNRHISTSPIKGTIRRGDTPAQDQQLAETLRTSEKDRAENIMIVDLMRNDLTRICAPGTVKATALCTLESFHDVHHLVSRVEGQLHDDFDAVDALFACFPAGSITGAPKLRAIELIADIEQSARGPYTGSMFYIDQSGNMDSNVLIRTATLVNTHATYGAGGAVVADSIPQSELAEAKLKARAFINALGQDN